jgi:thioredoxin-related protein
MVRKSTCSAFKILFSFFISLCLLNPSAAKGFDDSVTSHIEYPAWFNESPFHDLADNLNKSLSSGKKGLMVLFTTEGCSYCDLFIKKSLNNSEIASEVQNRFDSVGLEIFDDVGMISPQGKSLPVKEFAHKEGVQYSPTLLFFSKDAKRVLRVVGYQSPERFRAILNYVAGNHFRTESLRNYLKANLTKKKPTTLTKYNLKHDPLFNKPPYALDRSRFAAEQPLLVIFEKSGCVECKNFHADVLALKEIRKILGKFEIVRFDATDSKTPILAPDGKRVTPASWFKQTSFSRLPALMFFNEKGRNVLDTDALVRRQRMINSLNFVLERAYEKGWTYQRFARSKSIERSLKKQQ